MHNTLDHIRFDTAGVVNVKLTLQQVLNLVDALEEFDAKELEDDEVGLNEDRREAMCTYLYGHALLEMMRQGREQREKEAAHVP